MIFFFTINGSIEYPPKCRYCLSDQEGNDRCLPSNDRRNTTKQSRTNTTNQKDKYAVGQTGRTLYNGRNRQVNVFQIQAKIHSKTITNKARNGKDYKSSVEPQE